MLIMLLCLYLYLCYTGRKLCLLQCISYISYSWEMVVVYPPLLVQYFKHRIYKYKF